MNERKCDFCLPYMGKTNPICMHIDTIYLKKIHLNVYLYLWMKLGWIVCLKPTQNTWRKRNVHMNQRVIKVENPQLKKVREGTWRNMKLKKNTIRFKNTDFIDFIAHYAKRISN